MPRTPGSLFVGRKAELGLLRGELAAALAGEGRLALLVGEAGIGKTRTASALAGEAHEAGALVAWGHCCEGDGVPVYRPWLQALDACAAELPSSVPATLVARLRETGGPSDGATGAPEHARFELFERFLAALAAIGRERPIVLVLDDLQWGDVGSLRLLEFVARELRPHRLLLLGTVRAAEPCPSRARAELLASVARSARSVPLGALDRPAVRKLLGERLGRHPEEALLDRVYRASGGNPFFVIELAHLVAAAGADSPLPVPPAARQVLRERLAPLSPASLRALEAAAVLGPEFELDPLAAVLRQPVETLLATLAEPFALGLVRELPDARRRCAFGHALVRELLYTSLPPAARSALHGALAEALEAAGPADGERLAALAHHFFEAAQSGDPAKAIRYGCEAGEHALASLAYEEAARRFERALAAAALGGDDAARLRALVGLGEALSGAGDLARRDAVFAEAVGVARRIGSGAFATTALRWAIARTELGVPGIEVNALLEEALSILPGDPSPLRARLMARLAAGLHLLPGTEARRQELAEAAVAMARGLDDPATLAFVRARSLMGLLGPDGLERRLATTDEILRAGPASRVAELETLLLRVDDLVERADRAALDPLLGVFEQKARASRQPFFLWSVAVFRAALALLEGRFGEAETLCADALALGRTVQPQTAFLRFAQQLFFLRGWQGRLAEVEPLLEKGAAETAVVPAWRAALANFYELAGRPAESRRELDALAAEGFAGLPRDANWLTAMHLLAGVAARLGETSCAERIYDLLLPYRDRIAVARPLIVVAGPIALRLGMLATRLGRYEVAGAHFAEAQAQAERMRALPFQADIRFQWAEMLRRRGARGDLERAAALLDEAEAIAAAVGMTLLLERIAGCRQGARRGAAAVAVGRGRAPQGALVRRGAVLPLIRRSAAAPAPPPRAPAETERAGTFRREGDVWTFVFEGRTTRLRGMRGLLYLAELLARPDRERHAGDLVGAAAARSTSAGETPAAAAAGDAGERLDARARAAYESRLRDVRDELEEAQRRNDLGRSERLRDEMELLAAELARAYGLGGRPRRAASTQERARLSVTRAIKYAIDKIAPHDPALAEHLRRAVRTGTYCCYSPSERERVHWTL